MKTASSHYKNFNSARVHKLNECELHLFKKNLKVSRGKQIRAQILGSDLQIWNLFHEFLLNCFALLFPSYFKIRLTTCPFPVLKSRINTSFCHISVRCVCVLEKGHYYYGHSYYVTTFNMGNIIFIYDRKNTFMKMFL